MMPAQLKKRPWAARPLAEGGDRGAVLGQVAGRRAAARASALPRLAPPPGRARRHWHRRALAAARGEDQGRLAAPCRGSPGDEDRPIHVPFPGRSPPAPPLLSLMPSASRSVPGCERLPPRHALGGGAGHGPRRLTGLLPGEGDLRH